MQHTASTPLAAPATATRPTDPRTSTVQLVVEAPQPGLRLLGMAGRLDPAAAARLLRLLDAQLDLVAAGYADTTHLVIDLAGVTGFEPGGLEALRHAPYTAARRGITVALCGCGGRTHLLPLRTRALLAEFRTFPTAEAATDALTRATS